MNGNGTSGDDRAISFPEADARQSYPDGFDEEWVNDAIELQIREADGSYTTRYWCSDAFDADSGETVLGWADDLGNYDAETSVNLGQGAWLISHSVDTLASVSGAVSVESVTVGGDCRMGDFTNYLLVGSPFPVAFRVNDTAAVSWIATAGVSYPDGFDEGWIDNASEIQIRELDGSYTTRYWCSDAFDADSGETVLGWADDLGNYDPEAIVGVGGGFWMCTPATCRDADGKQLIYCTVKNPLAK